MSQNVKIAGNGLSSPRLHQTCSEQAHFFFITSSAILPLRIPLCTTHSTNIILSLSLGEAEKSSAAAAISERRRGLVEEGKARWAGCCCCST